MLVVTQRPETTYLDKTSTWNAVGNPIVYKFQRKDFVFDLINDAATFIQLQFTGVDVSASFVVGDTIYIQSDNGVYDLFAEVTASAFGAGDTLITVDAAYISAAPGGFTNNDDLKPSYRVEVEAYNSDDEIIGVSLIYSPNNKGYLLVDVSGILNTAILPDIDSDLTSVDEVYIDTDAHVRFYIKYLELWAGSAEAQTDDVANTFDVIKGARQVPSQFGGNMFEYVIDTQTIISGWRIRKSAADNAWVSIAYGAGLFVAVSPNGSGNRVMTSPDGIIWTSRVSAANNSWAAVTFGNGLFVAVAQSGTGNRVMTSPDGINWTIRVSAADNSWTGIIYGNGLFVAVGQSGTGNRVMTSPDGIVWTSRVSAADNQWMDVAFGNNTFVSVARTGTGDRVMTSPDGINWTLQTSAADNSWNSVVFGNGVFIAVASSGTDTRIMTSLDDGVTWGTVVDPGNENWNDVAFGNNTFVAVASSGTDRTMISIDNGVSWTLITAAASNQWNGVAFALDRFVSVGTTGTGNRVMTMSDIEIGARFLTKLERPVFWRGYPYLISAAVGDSITLLLDAGADETTATPYSNDLIHFDLNKILTDQTVDSFDIVIEDGADVELSETLTVDVRDACANPVLLVGRNSLGGALCWLFDKNQEYVFDYGNDIKAKRLVLYADNLTVNEWESLQDFIGLGDVYRNNITELTSSVIKTSSRIGQQLYIIDSDGNKTGVVVIPTKNKTETNHVKHFFELEIEFPEVLTA